MVIASGFPVVDGGVCLNIYTNSKAAGAQVRVPDPSV